MPFWKESERCLQKKLGLFCDSMSFWNEHSDVEESCAY
jgi:hypothetical protein